MLCYIQNNQLLTGDLSLPEGERYHHVERSEAASIDAAADWLVVVCRHLEKTHRDGQTLTRLFNTKSNFLSASATCRGNMLLLLLLHPSSAHTEASWEM